MEIAKVRWLGTPCLRAALSAALYLAFAAKLTWSEVCAGLFSAVLVATAMSAVERPTRQRSARQRKEFVLPPARWAVLLMASAIADTARVIALLTTAIFTGRPTSGTLHSVPFDSGGSAPRDVARRTWVTLGNSLSPNSVVIAVDRANHRLLIHRLAAADEDELRREEWPL